MTDRKLLQLSPRHQQLARLLVGGHSQSEIARILNVHKSTVSRLVRDPLVLNEIDRLQEMADVNTAACVPGIPEKLQKAAHLSIDIIEKILSDERDDPDMSKIKANVALDILGRAGYGIQKQVRVESVSTHLTSDDIAEIKRRAKENCGIG